MQVVNMTMKPMDCPVVEVTDPPEGWTEFKIRDSRGKRIAFCQIDSTCLDDELQEAFHDWQARHAHERPDLRVMPASASVAS